MQTAVKFQQILDTRNLMFLAVILAAITIVRCFDSNFWTDECYTIHAIHLSYGEILHYLLTADAHPPTYYYFAKVLCDVFGYTPFVYHMTAYIPFVLILIVSLTLVRRTFGNETAFVVMVCGALLTSSFKYATEVRMYELALLFMLLFAVYFYRVMESDDSRLLTKDTLLLALFTVLASYTHIFCAIGIGMFLMIALPVVFRWKREKFKHALLAFVVFGAACFPVAIYAASRFDRFPDDFWITGFPPLWEVYGYIFGQKEMVAVTAVFTVILALVLYHLFGKGKCDVCERYLEPAEERPSVDGIFLLLCISSILATILLSFIVTVAVRPVFSTRYIYPLTVLVWLSLGICITKFRDRFKILGLVTLVILVFVIPMNVYDGLKEMDTISETDDTLSRLHIGHDDFVATDSANPVTIEYYLDVTYENIMWMKDFNTDMLRTDVDNWLILWDHIGEAEIQMLSDSGHGYETVLEDGHIGKYQANVYRVV